MNATEANALLDLEMSASDRAYWERAARREAAAYDPEATLVSPPSSEGTSTRCKRSK